MKKGEVWFKKSRLLNPLIAFYFFVVFIEIIAEYNQDNFFIKYTEPLVIPILIAIYWVSSRVKNKHYLFALLLLFIANLFIISEASSSRVIGTLFLIFSQLLYIYLVMEKIKYPGSSLLMISSLPYFCICIFVAVLIYNAAAAELYLFIVESIPLIFFGGLSLANYFIKYNKLNSQLFASASILFVAQLLVIIESFYSNSGMLKALSTVFLAVGNYIFYQFVLGQDRRQKKYKIIK
jgi:hypothetical protein